MKTIIARIRKYLCKACGAEFLVPKTIDGRDYCPCCGSQL